VSEDTAAPTRLLDSAELKRRRILAGYSQPELATRAGIDKAHISRLESGLRDVKPATLRRLAKVLQCKMTDLMPQPVGDGQRAS
jgi:transcriptional regulator with XRE-family HTH domain